jgi:hypothetical protein
MPKRRTTATLLTFSALCIAIAAFSFKTRAQVQSSPDGNAPGASAQHAFAPTPPPLTKLEKFASQSGIVIIKSYTVIGELAGDDGSSIRITAVRFADSASPSSHQDGIVVQVREPQGGRETLSYVDLDELANLSDAVRTLGALQPSDALLQEFEGHYATHADLEFANVNIGGGRMVGIKGVQFVPLTGQVITAVAQFRVSRTNELGQLLTNARKALDALNK